MAYKIESSFEPESAAPLDYSAVTAATQKAKGWDAVTKAIGVTAQVVGRIKTKEDQDKATADRFEATRAAQDLNNNYLSTLTEDKLIAELDGNVVKVNKDDTKSDVFKQTYERYMLGAREGYSKNVADYNAATILKTSSASTADLFEAMATIPNANTITRDDMREWVKQSDLGLAPDQYDEALALGAVTYAGVSFSKAQTLEDLRNVKGSIDDQLNGLIGVQGVTVGTREHKILSDASRNYEATYQSSVKAITERASLRLAEKDLALKNSTFVEGDNIVMNEPDSLKSYMFNLSNSGKPMAEQYKLLNTYSKGLEAFYSDRTMFSGLKSEDPKPVLMDARQTKVWKEKVKNSMQVAMTTGNIERAQNIIASHPEVDPEIGNMLITKLNSPNFTEAIKTNTTISAIMSTPDGRRLITNTTTPDQYNEIVLSQAMYSVYGPPMDSTTNTMMQTRITDAKIAARQHGHLDTDTNILIDKATQGLPPQIRQQMMLLARSMAAGGATSEIKNTLEKWREGFVFDATALNGEDITVFNNGRLNLKQGDRDTLGYVLGRQADMVLKENPYMKKDNLLAITDSEGNVNYFDKENPTMMIGSFPIQKMIADSATDPKFKQAMEEEYKTSRNLQEGLLGQIAIGGQKAVNFVVDSSGKIDEVIQDTADAIFGVPVDYVNKQFESLWDAMVAATPKEGTAKRRGIR